MQIRLARQDEYPAVRAFYHALIDAMQSSNYAIGWKKDVYPAPEFLRASIEEKELYVGLEKETIIAAMVLNHSCNDGYKEFHWPTMAPAEEVTIIHALGVHPRYSGRGFAKQMVQFAINTARKTNQKVIRLDVLKGNVPAERLYASLGFQYLHTLSMFYEDTGWTDYELYERRL
ncbi:MAG: GNAT family N-acetyltransferase [Eubacteriales bacterium]|jgi:ribosomal protein S18 acetylase RimI-like enzyme